MLSIPFSAVLSFGGQFPGGRGDDVKELGDVLGRNTGKSDAQVGLVGGNSPDPVFI